MLGLNGTAKPGGGRTSPYRGKQVVVRGVEEAIQERARRITLVHGTNTKLIGAVLIMAVVVAYLGYTNHAQWKDGIREVPYVAIMDQWGIEHPAMKVSELTVTPEQSVIITVLETWIECVRSISPDETTFGRCWDRVRDYTSNAGMKQLEPFQREQKVRQENGARVQLDRISVWPMDRSKISYNVKWEERSIDRQGEIIAAESGVWEATVTMVDYQSKAAKQERELRRKEKNYRNLVGIVVDSIPKWKGHPLTQAQVRGGR